MNNINNGLSIHCLGPHTLVINDAGMVNASALIKQFHGRIAHEFLTTHGVLPILADISERTGRALAPQWSEVNVVRGQRLNFLFALKAAEIIHEVSGDPGRRAKAGGGAFGLGVRDYRSGLWIRPELAVPLARWAEQRPGHPETGLFAGLVEQALADLDPGQETPRQREMQTGVADHFIGQVDKLTMADLRKADEVLIADGVPIAERYEVLQARLARQQGV